MWIQIRIRGSIPLTNTNWMRIRILLFSSLTFKMPTKNYCKKSQVNNLHFFLVAHCLFFSNNQPFRLGRGGCTWPGGGMHRGGRGDARASCASPLGTPLGTGMCLGCFSTVIYRPPFLYKCLNRYSSNCLVFSDTPLSEDQIDKYQHATHQILKAAIIYECGYETTQIPEAIMHRHHPLQRENINVKNFTYWI